eukprot:Mycagemm_TRINITY_DN9885_c0_g2::TRINITY_DN9885_c0_g2_i1::g.147::m.147 type:complete len:100 gc:universal TRINITY_DN9885_c0_g2_i1:754-455(-)
MSEIEEMISEKKLLLAGSSSSSNTLACWSQRAESRMSPSLMVPLELLYMSMLHWLGWKSAQVMTSVSSSMLGGLMSTMLNDAFVMPRFQRLMRRSSDEM